MFLYKDLFRWDCAMCTCPYLATSAEDPATAQHCRPHITLHCTCPSPREGWESSGEEAGWVERLALEDVLFTLKFSFDTHSPQLTNYNLLSLWYCLVGLWCNVHVYYVHIQIKLPHKFRCLTYMYIIVAERSLDLCTLCLHHPCIILNNRNSLRIMGE